MEKELPMDMKEDQKKELISEAKIISQIASGVILANTALQILVNS